MAASVKKGPGRFRMTAKLKRVSSPRGVQERVEEREANMPAIRSQGEYTRPGSRNRRKVGRG